MLTHVWRRWSAVLLLLLSPAVGGQILPLLHPCPAEQQRAAGQGTATDRHAGHGAHATPPPAPGHQHESGEGCTCPGTCHVASLAPTPFAATEIAVAIAAPTVASWPVAERSVPSPRPIDRLPPQTAPPIV